MTGHDGLIGTLCRCCDPNRDDLRDNSPARQNGGGSSGSGGAPLPITCRSGGSRQPGGRVVLVTPDGVVTVRMPSSVMVNRQCGAWVLSRWCRRHSEHRLVQAVSPPSA